MTAVARPHVAGVDAKIVIAELVSAQCVLGGPSDHQPFGFASTFLRVLGTNPTDFEPLL
jgi:hypothetical protein